MNKITITEGALNVLSTECAHVWKSTDKKHEGLGVWVGDLLRSKLDTVEDLEEDFDVDIGGGITLYVEPQGMLGDLLVSGVTYTPSDGVKITKIASFGKTGVSYFVNQSVPENGLPNLLAGKKLNFRLEKQNR